MVLMAIKAHNAILRRSMSSVVEGTTPPPAPTVEETSYLEGTLVHVRCLVDFLRGKADGRDICTSNFVVGGWKSSNTTLTARFDPLSQWLSHLTWERVRSQNPKWNPGGLTKDVLDEYSVFVSAVSRDPQHHPEVLRALRAIHRTADAEARGTFHAEYYGIGTEVVSDTSSSSMRIVVGDFRPRPPK